MEQAEKKLVVSSSPHIKGSGTTQKIMCDVLIALTPAAIFGIFNFGWYQTVVIITAVFSCILAEYVTRMVMKRPQTVTDMSAAVTGMLLALNLPPGISLIYVIIGSVFAIVIVKQLFGGLGHNFVNPAIAARIFLLVAYSDIMTKWPSSLLTGKAGVDAVSGATPLSVLKDNFLNGTVANLNPDYAGMFIGTIPGCIGETSKIALLIGAGYLLYRKVISWEIPVVYIATTGLFAFIFGGDTFFTGPALYHILSGGLIIGAFFMATDYTTSPVTRRGKMVYAVGLGLLTGLIRIYTNYPEGVSFAILLMNVVTPLIDRYITNKPFGKLKEIKEAKV